MSASEEEKIPAVEMEKNSTREGGGPGCIGINLEGKDQHEIDQEAKKIQDPMDTEDPASRVGSAVINKEEQLSGAENTQVPLDAKEPWRWHATFSAGLKCKRILELHKGFILLRGNVKRIALLDTDGTKLDAKYLKEGET